MQTVRKSKGARPRVLFFGMQSTFSSPPLVRLLDYGLDVCAVVLPATTIPGRALPAIQRWEPVRTGRTLVPLASSLQRPSILQIAQGRGLPIWAVGRLGHPETVATLAEYAPDFICVACFSRLIPRTLREIASKASLNVHPSLLPEHRGPVPLFWTLRAGDSQAGVTIHALEEPMDSGDIFAQQAFPIPDGIRSDALEAQCAEVGAQLLLETILAISAGRARRTPQDESRSSYQSFPGDEDFMVHASDWSARHLYNFVRGVSDWHRPVEVFAAGQRLWVRDAISYSLDGRNEIVNEEGVGVAGRWRIALVMCQTGWVRVVLDEEEGEG